MAESRIIENHNLSATQPFPAVPSTPAGLLSRIQNYLGNGGLFNPEYMEHNKVRDLILDISEYLHESQNR